jgi:two-component system, LytTR family, sensor kinase
MKGSSPAYVKGFRRFEKIISPVLGVVITYLYYGTSSGSNLKTFLLILLIGSVCFLPHIFIAYKVNIYFFGKWPDDSTVLKRQLLSIPITTITSFLALNLTANIADRFSLYPFNQERFIWAFIAQAIFNIFMIFMLVGFREFEEWEKNYAETEKLNATYKQSQLNGLKSQVNPHFLFNSLNSLSSLIQEDEEKAEYFLNEMSKVYRYMLRNDEEQLVSLYTELKFLSSYTHLLQARYGDGLQLKINIDNDCREKKLAPLTLQVLIENAFAQNIVSKTSPLIIEIFNDEHNNLIVKNNIQSKAVTNAIDFEAGLDNLISKYELIGKKITVDEGDKHHRIITIPLLENKEEVLL